jgi:hypothetical protein
MFLRILQPQDTLEVYAGEEGDEREVDLVFEAFDHGGLFPRSACMRVFCFSISKVNAQWWLYIENILGY